nr:phage exclusion protein Lit family protein [Stenotrophomonas geniculata]
MPSPILALEGNIVQAFENPNGSAVEQLRVAVEEGLVSHQLDLMMDFAPPRGPCIVRSQQRPASIVVHVTHLELLWAFTYGWVVLYEEAVQRAMIDGVFDGRILLEADLTSRAAALLEWASGLRNAYTPWPRGLPSPTHADSEQERSYALKINGIFQYATAFLLYHEFGHVQLGHLDAIDLYDEAPETLVTAVQLEREADDFAYRALVAHDDSDPVRRLKGWAVLVPALSSLYLVDGRAGLYQRRHPHLHHRIADLLAKLNFQDEQSRFYYHYLCSTVLLTFDRAYQANKDAPLTPRVFETVDDAFAAEMDDLDNFLSARH